MNDEKVIEQKLQDKGLNAPRLSPDDIDAVIVAESFTVLPSGKCMICELTLVNGFTVRGESACVSVNNFNEEIGREISRKNARDKIWGFEGYLLQQRLHEGHGLSLIQERKYTVQSGKIINRATGKAIPDDEPIMIFRAKDEKSCAALFSYMAVCKDEIHQAVINGRINDFKEFQQNNFGLVREPDSDPSCLPGAKQA